MTDSFEASKQALLELKNTAVIDGLFKVMWTNEDVANMEKLSEQDVAECILFATLEGHERLVQALVFRRGVVPVEVKTIETKPPTYVLNGEPVDLKGLNFLRHLKTREFFDDEDEFDTEPDLNSLLEMIVTYGMKGLIEPGESYPLMLRNTCSSPFEDKFNTSSFGGDLPELSGGVLREPALAIALASRSASAVAPESLKPLLCWASAEMVGYFPENLTPLKPYQTVAGHGTLQEWRAKSGEPGNLEFEQITVGIDFPEEGGFANLLIDAMAPESAKLGFSHPAGLVLCETSTDFLLHFEMAPSSDEGIASAEKFVKGYCPILIMHQQAAELCRGYGYELPFQGTPQIFQNTMHTNFYSLFSLLDKKNPLHERAKDLMTRDQWCALAKKGQTTISSASLLALWNTFKIDNTGLRLLIEPGEVAFLANKHYVFSEETKVFNNSESFTSDHADIGETRILIEGKSPLVPDYWNASQNKKGMSIALGVFKKVLKANIWPTQEGWPKNLEAALRRCQTYNLDDFENNDGMLLRTYLRNEGVEACVNAVTSPGQWQKLITVFGSEEMTPYLGRMPKSARGEMLESVLGL